MNAIYKLALIVLAIATFSACEEVINIDLNTASPKLSVTAIITDQPGPYYVTLTKSESFFSSNNSFPAVNNAAVVISDDAGNTEKLTEIKAGVYQTTNLQGVNGRTYHLSIETNGNKYVATSYLPYPISLDSVATQKITATGPGNKENKNKYYLKCYFTDPEGSEDYYRVEPIIPNLDTLSSSYQIYSDEVTDGQHVEFPIQKPTFKLGDTAIVEFYHVNKENYNYYKTANNILKSRKGPMASASAPQANPLTNISGEAVGYFGTFTVSKRVVVVR